MLNKYTCSLISEVVMSINTVKIYKNSIMEIQEISVSDKLKSKANTTVIFKKIYLFSA